MDGTENNAPAPEVRVRFGKRPNQTVPLEWAEAMLTKLQNEKPSVFGSLLVSAASGDQ